MSKYPRPSPVERASESDFEESPAASLPLLPLAEERKKKLNKGTAAAEWSNPS
jgi:hypothetical protein